MIIMLIIMEVYIMSMDKLRDEFDKFLEEKNFNYSDPDVISKGLEIEKLMYKQLKQAEA